MELGAAPEGEIGGGPFGAGLSVSWRVARGHAKGRRARSARGAKERHRACRGGLRPFAAGGPRSATGTAMSAGGRGEGVGDEVVLDGGDVADDWRGLKYSRGVEQGPRTLRKGLGRSQGLHAFRSFFGGEPPWRSWGKKGLRSLFIVP